MLFYFFFPITTNNPPSSPSVLNNIEICEKKRDKKVPLDEFANMGSV